MTDTEGEKTTITVCSECFTSACWFGEFMCGNAIQAGTVEKTVAELALMNLENPEWWDINPKTGHPRMHDEDIARFTTDHTARTS